MIRKLTLAAGLTLVVAAATPQFVSAATVGPYTPIPKAAEDGTLVQQVQWGYCRRWARECSYRWGWNSPRFFRCMAFHGC